MNKAGISFEEMKKDLLKDSEFKTEYDKLTLRYETIKQTITDSQKACKFAFRWGAFRRI